MSTRRRRRIPNLKAGVSPGTLTVPAGAAPSRVRVTRFGPQTLEVHEPVSAADLPSRLEGPACAWVEVAGLGTEELFQALAERVGVPRLALEDVLNGIPRPKADSYEEGLFVELRLPRPGEGLELDGLSAFLRKGVLVTIAEREPAIFPALRSRLADPASRLRQWGADYLLYRIVDSAVDSFFPLLDGIATRLDGLERGALDQPTARGLRELYQVVEEIRGLRSAAVPTRELVSSLRRDSSGTFQSRTHPYLRDVEDHAATLIDLVDRQRDFAVDVRQLIHDSLNLRLNQTMRILAAVSAVFIPLTLVTGIYGMNFEHMPELRWRYGYFAVLGLLLLLGWLAWRLFRRYGWIRIDDGER